MRFIFSSPGSEAAGLLDLPWGTPLADWDDPRLVDYRNAGIHRHVVQFVAEGGDLFVLKELPEDLARREYRLLRHLAEVSVPAVDVVGVCLDREEMEAILVTRFLDYSVTYRSLVTRLSERLPLDALLGGLVELLVRLHLAGLLWGDCSLSNTLFRLDAGDFEAYLVDAETAELHPALTDGQRQLDLDLAYERIAGELMDLLAGQLLPDYIDPIATAQDVMDRYALLWHEVTREDVIARDEQRYLIGERIRRLEDLGFDVAEVELLTVEDGSRVRLRTQVADPGRWGRVLMMRTGLDVQDRQARRLLGDIAAFRAWLEQSQGRSVPEVVAASTWLTEVYDPVINAIPKHERDRVDEAEVFHEVLEYRWLLSEQAGRDVSTTAAARDYMERLLPERFEPRPTDARAFPEGPLV